MFNAVEMWSILNLCRHESKGNSPVVLGNSEVKFLGEREDVALYPSVYCVLIIYGVAVSEQYVVEFPCFPYFWWYFINTGSFLFLIFVCTTPSSSYVNCPSLMYRLLLIFFVIYSSVTLEDFQSRFLKCSFHKRIRSFWLAAFSFTHAILFLLLTSFTVCHIIRDYLSSTECLILLDVFRLFF